MATLYHGSPVGGLKVLTTKSSLELVPQVYATDNLAYALVRAGQQLGTIREEYRGLLKPFEIAECYPHAFEQMFNHEGFVYLLDSRDFKINQDNPDEYVSDRDVLPWKCVKIGNVYQHILSMRGRYKLYYYGTPEWELYWNNVKGGLEGFLERKAARRNTLLVAKGRS